MTSSLTFCTGCTIPLNTESIKRAYALSTYGRVIGIGGADWSTYGVSQRGFSNSLNLQYRSNSIEMTGYNYDRLYRFAQDLCDLLRQNPRAVDVAIVTPGHENQEDEYYVRYNWERLKLLGITPGQIHSAVNDLLLTHCFHINIYFRLLHFRQLTLEYGSNAFATLRGKRLFFQASMTSWRNTRTMPTISSDTLDSDSTHRLW